MTCGPFTCNQLTKAHTAEDLLYGHSWGSYMPSLITAGPDNRHSRQPLLSQSLPELFKLDNPKPIYPSIPFL